MTIERLASPALGALLGAMLLAATQPGHAALPNVTEPAGINLGNTSYMDGFTPKPGQAAYLAYARYTRATAIKDDRGDDIAAFNDPHVSVFAYVSQFAYTFEKPHFWNAHLGITGLIPITMFDTHFDQPGASLEDSGTGFGDLTIGPYLQFDPLTNADGRPVLSTRLEFDVLAPLGRYDEDKDLNAGANFWSLNPNWAGTLMPTPKLSMSWRLHYLYNFENHDPAGSEPLSYEGAPVHSTRAGQAAWLNFTVAYEVAPKLRMGLNGYYFKQFSDDEVNDDTFEGSKEQVLGIGPGLFWDAPDGNLLMTNLYTETAVENRAKNPVVVVLHWIHNF